MLRMKKVIDFEEAKLRYKLDKIVRQLRKIYNDIEISYYFLPQQVGFKFVKNQYIRLLMIPYIELESYNIEQLLKFNLNNFCYEIYEKREKEIKGEKNVYIIWKNSTRNI